MHFFHLQRYLPLVASGNIVVNRTLFQEVKELFKITHWQEKVLTLCRLI